MHEQSPGGGLRASLTRLGRGEIPRVVLALSAVVLVVPPLLAYLSTSPPAGSLASVVPAVSAHVLISLWVLVAPRPVRARRAAVATGLLSVLAVLVVFVDRDPAWLILFYYPAVAAALTGRPVRAAPVAGLVAAVAATSTVALLGNPDAAVEIGLQCTYVGGVSLLVVHLLNTNEQLMAARAEVARLAAADERLRIARDLHDLLGHGLSVISLKAQLAGRLLPGDPVRARREVGDIEGVSRQALEDVRAAVSGYRRVTLRQELATATEALRAAGITAEVDHQAGDDLNGEVDQALAWAVREGTTNIIRHARATSSALRTRWVADRVHLEIADDGPGVAADGLADGGAETAPRGSGLAGLAERVAALGGTFEAGPRPQGGFRLALELPARRAGS
jgi:two-component system sensor histidine kinase DesK